MRAQAQSGFYDEALQTLSGLKQLTGQERTDLEDVITVEQARVFALRGDVKSADNTFAQLHDPQFAVSGYWIDQINAPAKREYLNYSSRTMFWTRIARQLVNDDHCWAVDLDLYHQIMSWPEVGKFPQQDINGWFMVGGGTRVSADRINTGCERVAPLQLWTEFAQTICEKGWECNWSDAVKYASSQNDFVAVSSRLADVAKEIRGLVLAYEALDARTQRPRGK